MSSFSTAYAATRPPERLAHPRHPPLAYTYIRSSTNSCARALPLQVTPAFLCPQSSPEVSTRGKPTRPDPSPPQRPTTLSSPILSYKPQAGPTPPLDKLYAPQIRKNTFQLQPVSSRTLAASSSHPASGAPPQEKSPAIALIPYPSRALCHRITSTHPTGGERIRKPSANDTASAINAKTMITSATRGKERKHREVS